MNTNPIAGKTTSVRFQCSYGSFQPRYLWLLPLMGIIAVVGIPLGIFWNQGWQMANHPVEPWAATMIIEILAVGALVTGVSLGLVSTIRRKSPSASP